MLRYRGRSLHWRRARFASCLAAVGERPTMGAISPMGRWEQVVQHERDPLDGTQRFEYHEQRETDRAGQ